MKFLIFAATVFSFFSCSTLVHRKLPILNSESIQSNKKIKISFSEHIGEDKKNELYQTMLNMGLAKNLTSEITMPIKYKQTPDIKEFKDFFPERNINYSDSWNYEIKLTWKRYEFNEPYCIVFLTAIPCTFGINWMVGARIVDQNSNIIKDYVTEETAMHLYWLYFLNPKSWFEQKNVYDEALENQVKNLMIEIQRDGFL